VSPPRTLPIRLGPLPGEALDSWLEAIAHRLAVPLNDLMWAIGLTGGAHRRSNRPGSTDRTIALPPADARAIAVATGLNEPSVHATTLARYDQRAVLLDPVTRLVKVRTLWGRGQGSRYCPDCLAATGGRWQLRWRLSWSFACPAHQRLLADDCPSCGRSQRFRCSAQHDPPRPGYCENPVHPAEPERGRVRGPTGAHVRCGTDLSRAATIFLPDDHPVLRAQRLLDDLIETGTADFGVYATRPQPVVTALADLRAIAGRAIAYTHNSVGGPATAAPAGDPVTTAIQALAQAQHQRASARAKIRPGAMAPPTAATAAVGLTTACNVLLAADVHAAAAAVGWLVTAPRPGGRATSPSTVDDWGRTTSPVLHAVKLAALGPGLRPTDQLRYRTASPAPREPDVTTAAAARQRAARIPTLCWPSWTVRLCPPHGALTRMVRPALSSALLLVGTHLNLTDAAELLGSATGCQQISKTVQLLQATEQWPDTAAALIRLAGHLDAHNIPIDYQRRRQLDYRRLLPAAEWRRLCRHARTPRDPGVYARAARCVLFEQLSGLPACSAPFGSTASTPAFRVKMTQLAVVITPGLADGLQQSAASFLARHGVTGEPVAWDPPLRLLDGLHLPGTNPNEIDLEHLHRLIRRDHASIPTTAHRLGTTSEAVQLLLHQHPAPAIPATRKVGKSHREIPSRDQFAQYYLGEHLSLAEIAKRAGLSSGYAAQLARDYRIPVRGQKDYTVRQHPVLTRDWLHHQYLTCGRSLQDLATETGMSKSAIRRWARIYAIPTPHRYPIRMNIPAAAAAAPLILRPTVTGPGAWKRLRRLAAASPYSSLSQAATRLGISPTVLTTQVNRLEHELGQRLLERAPGQKAMRPTPFGRKVIAAIRAAERRQARDSSQPPPPAEENATKLRHRPHATT
jgi:molybdenum-dependent DNA-binding transcriptional regulator ModE